MLFQLSPNLNSPIIPAKAGIHEALIWIPAFAGMVGVGRMGKGVMLNRPKYSVRIAEPPDQAGRVPAAAAHGLNVRIELIDQRRHRQPRAVLTGLA